MTRALAVALALLLAADLVAGAAAQEESTAATAPAATAPAAGEVGRLTLAVLDFDASDPADPDLGKNIGEAVTAILSAEPGLTLVDRANLQRVLQEHELNLTGVIDNQEATRAGKLVGARLMVMGRVFPVGKQVWITAKIVGTETGLVEAVLLKGEAEADMDARILELAAALAERVRARGKGLVASEEEFDPLPALRERLKGRELPRVAVIVVEEDRTRRVALDPAVETEIKRMLIGCGFAVQDVPQNDLADWSRLMRHDEVGAWPRSLRRVDAVITGEAFSEVGARLGNLASASCRAEVNVIRRSDGVIVHADRATARGVDLADGIAGKKALENAGRQIGVRLLEYFAGDEADAERPEAP